MRKSCSPLSTEPNHPAPKSGVIPSISSVYDHTIEMNISEQCLSLNLLSPNNDTDSLDILAIPSLPKPCAYTLSASVQDHIGSHSDEKARVIGLSRWEFSELNDVTYLQSADVGDININGTSTSIQEQSVLHSNNLTETHREEDLFNKCGLTASPSKLAFEEIETDDFSCSNSPNSPKVVPNTIADEKPISSSDHLDTSPDTSDSVPKKLEDPEWEFAKLIPLVKHLNSRTLGGFLVQCLKDYYHQIPIKGLFHLLYGGDFPEHESLPELSTAGGERTGFSDSERKGLHYCSMIIETFKDPSTRKLLRGTINENLQVPGVTLHEVLRSLLAIKILFSSLRRVEYTFSKDSRVERLSVYKVYYAICQNLIQKHPSTQASSGRAILLSQSSLGKITKLINPNLISRRLGKRGQSKYHYIGLTWNRDVLEEEILKIIDLDIPQISSHFNQVSKKTKYGSDRRNQPHQIIQKHVSSGREEQSSTHSGSFWKTPSYSFVDFSSKYPGTDCCPRSWQTGINQIPQQSSWARDHMNRSLNVLKAFNIDLNPLIQNFTIGNLSGGQELSLSRTVLQAIASLKISKADTRTYMHLYLAILLLLFPVVVSSEKEVPRYKKLSLRSSVQQCVLQLESAMTTFSGPDAKSLNTFIGLLRSMKNLVDLTMTKIQADCAELVLKKMVRDLELAGYVQADGLHAGSSLEKLQIESLIMSMRAFNFTFRDTGSNADPQQEIATVTAVAKQLVKTVMMTKHTMSIMPALARNEGLTQVTEDLPYQLFIIGLKFFHEFTLRDPSIMKIPISVFNFILHHMSNMIPCCNFNGFLNSHPCHPDLPRESFKCCWVLFSMIQDYSKLLSEIVALTATLNQIPEHQ